MSAHNKIFSKLHKLGLPSDDYVIAGSGPFIVRGIIKPENDIDILARGKAWDTAIGLGTVEDDSFGRFKVVKLVDKNIEIFSGWAPGDWDINKLIEEADVFDNIRFVKLADVIKMKELSGRKKDKQHLKILKSYLENR